MKLIDLLREKSKEQVFGNVLFGDKDNDPKLAKLQGAKPGSEPDTEDESDLLAALNTWVRLPNLATDQLYKFKNDLKTVVNKFPELLKPSTPDGTLLYRGLRKVNPELKNQINESKPTNWTRVGTYYILKTPIKYTPRNIIQSWTPDFKKADEGFSEEGLLITRQNSEFLFNEKLFKVLYGLNEKEVLHFDVKYSGKVYIAIQEYSIRRIYKKHKEITNLKTSRVGVKNFSTYLK